MFNFGLKSDLRQTARHPPATHRFEQQRVNRVHIFRVLWSVCGVLYIDGLAQDCSNSIANAMELLQSCTKTSIYLTVVSFSRYIAESARQGSDHISCVVSRHPIINIWLL